MGEGVAQPFTIDNPQRRDEIVFYLVVSVVDHVLILHQKQAGRIRNAKSGSSVRQSSKLGMTQTKHLACLTFRQPHLQNSALSADEIALGKRQQNRVDARVAVGALDELA